METKKYSIWSNYRYSWKWFWRYEGKKGTALCIAFVLLEIICPFLGMALPSVVVGLLTSTKTAGVILTLLTGYVVLFQTVRLLRTTVSQRKVQMLFLFRVVGGDEFEKHCLKCSDEFIENAIGQKKMHAALMNLFGGNEIGVEAFLGAFLNLAVNFGGMVVYAAVIGTQHFLLMLLLLGLTFLGAWLNYAAGKYGYRYQEKEIEQWHQMRYFMRETALPENGKDIRLYRMKHWFLREMQKLVEKDVKVYTAEENCYMAAGIAEKLISFARDIGIYGYLIYQMVQGKMELSYFLLYIGIVAGYSAWMGGFLTAVQESVKNSKIITEYRDFLESGNPKKTGNMLPPAAGNIHEIRLEHVCFHYEGEERDTLSDINLTIHPGEKLALVGANGAGKTTLIKLICGLYEPTAGNIYLDGQDIKEIDREAYFKEFAVVFQDVFAFSFPLEENVSCVDSQSTDRKRLEDCLKQADLWEKVQGLSEKSHTTMNKDLDENGVTLSGGEMQKLMLARALYKNAPIVILDEPTAALDPIAESQMYEKYHELTKDKNSIFISHRLSSTQFCDRILYMEHGKIAEEGSHTELLAAGGAYANMFEVQAQYYKKKEQEEACYV